MLWLPLSHIQYNFHFLSPPASYLFLTAKLIYYHFFWPFSHWWVASEIVNYMGYVFISYMSWTSWKQRGFLHFSSFFFLHLSHTSLLSIWSISSCPPAHESGFQFSFFLFFKLHSQSFCTLHTYLNWLIYIAYSKGTFPYSYTNSTCGNWNSNIFADFCTPLTQISSSVAQFTKSDARQICYS